MEHRNYQCLRCKCREFEVGEIHVAGGFWSKVFDIEGRKFTSLTCASCSHTEFFKADRQGIGNILDLFVT